MNCSARGSTAQAGARAEGPSFFGRLLADAEARACAGPDGAAAVWGEPRTLAAVLEGLRRPSSGSAYTGDTAIRTLCRSKTQFLSGTGMETVKVREGSCGKATFEVLEMWGFQPISRFMCTALLT